MLRLAIRAEARAGGGLPISTVPKGKGIMRMITCVLLITAVGLLALPCWGEDPKTEPIAAVSVKAFGAKADGVTDDTAAFQKALDSAKAKGGIVLAPAGAYHIAGFLEVPEGVTLRGVWEAPHHSAIGQGTLLLATGGRGDDKGKPLIHLAENSCARGLTIIYPKQRLEEIASYPWTVLGEGMHCSVIDVTLVNSYRGIKMLGELHYIRGVYGCPLVVGIAVDGCTDIGRIEDVHFNPHYWVRAKHPCAPAAADSKKLFDYLRQNLVGFRLGRTDWEYMFNCFVILAKIGFHFIHTDAGDPNVVLTQCGSDVGETAVQVDACQGHAGVAFVNSQIMARVIVGPDNHGPVKFTNCGFWPVEETENQALLQGHQTTTFIGCHFWDWGMKNDQAPCILAAKGALIVTGCEFVAAKPQIRLEEPVLSAVISSNRFRNDIRITNNSKGDVQIGLNTKQ